MLLIIEKKNHFKLSCCILKIKQRQFLCYWETRRWSSQTLLLKIGRNKDFLWTGKGVWRKLYNINLAWILFDLPLNIQGSFFIILSYLPVKVWDWAFWYAAKLLCKISSLYIVLVFLWSINNGSKIYKKNYKFSYLPFNNTIPVIEPTIFLSSCADFWACTFFWSSRYDDKVRGFSIIVVSAIIVVRAENLCKS